MINIISYENESVQETPHGVDVRKLFDSEHVQVVEIKLLPDEGLKKHITHRSMCFSTCWREQGLWRLVMNNPRS